MKKKNKIILISIAAVFLIVAALFIIFNSRSPVIIVTEQSFVGLYGENRIRTESLRISLTLLRPVKTVIVANDAGDDIVPFAITEVSSGPFCVLFPLRFARSARYYREQNPEIDVIVLEGRYPADSNPTAGILQGSSQDDYFIYKTDISSEFFLAGMAAAALAGETEGNIAVFLESRQNSFFGVQAREAFLEGVNSSENSLKTSFFTSFSEYSDSLEPSCVVLIGSGSEFLDKKAEIPVILFSWVNPSYVPADVVIIVDDSPWAQAVRAVELAASGTTKGEIRSKIHFLDKKRVNKEFLRFIRFLR